LDQIVISATKWHQTNSEIPSKISTITPKDIEFYNPQTAADLLSISGDVFIQKSQQGGGSPMLRGFATNRVLLSVDGVRMNNAIFRSGNVQNVISLDPYSIENTEVLFGPGSIIYGSDAIGGSMNFYTLTAQFSLTGATHIKGSADYRFSSANQENTGHFDLNAGWKNFAMLSSISFNSYSDLMMGSKGPSEYLRNEYVLRKDGTDTRIRNDDPELQKFTGYNQLNLMQKLRYRYSENWYFDYGLHYSITTDYDRYDRLIRYSNGIPRSAEWYYGPQIWMMNNFKVTNLTRTDLYDDFMIRFAHQFFEESRNDRNFEDETLRTRVEKVNAFSLNLDLNKELTNSVHLLYGFETVFNTVESEGKDRNIITNFVSDGPSRYPESEWISLASYLVYQQKFNSELYFQSGIRYNHFIIDSRFDTRFYPFPFSSSYISDGSLTGSIGLTYTPYSTWSIGLNLSSGFRAPNVDDIGKVFDSEPGSVVVPNPDLKAEKAYNAELSIAKVINDALKIDLTTFYTYLSDAMVRRDFLLNGLDSINYNGELSQVQAIQNAANAYVWGAQAGMELKLYRHFVLSSKINYQYGEEELDSGEKSKLRHAAPLFGTVHLKYKSSDFISDLYMIYNGEIDYNDLAEEERGKTHIYAIDKNGNPYSPSWYSLNFKISYLFDRLKFTFGIDNITDERYRPYSSGVAAAGRNFIFSTKYSF
jgi:hemoglobin/transferrin/lactoferrin receptor protein